jgi:hypothetical protein
VGFPLVRLQFPLTLKQSPSGNELHEALNDQLNVPAYALLEQHHALSNEHLLLA